MVAFVEEFEPSEKERSSYERTWDFSSSERKNASGDFFSEAPDCTWEIEVSAQISTKVESDEFTTIASGRLYYRYTGEQYDPDLEMYFLRARYNDTDKGRLHNMDTFEGRKQEPVTLHKYLYANANPVNGIDPSGNWTLMELGIAAGIGATVNVAATIALNWSSYKGKEYNEIAAELGEAAAIGAFAGLSGGGVAARLSMKIAWPVMSGAIAGLAAGVAGQFLTEFIDYAFHGKTLTFEHLCGSSVRIVTAGFGGFLTGGLLSKFNVTTTKGTKAQALPTLTFDQTTINVGATAAVGGGNLMESVVRGSIGLDSWICSSN